MFVVVSLLMAFSFRSKMEDVVGQFRNAFTSSFGDLTRFIRGHESVSLEESFFT